MPSWGFCIVTMGAMIGLSSTSQNKERRFRNSLQKVCLPLLRVQSNWRSYSKQKSHSGAFIRSAASLLIYCTCGTGMICVFIGEYTERMCRRLSFWGNTGLLCLTSGPLGSGKDLNFTEFLTFEPSLPQGLLALAGRHVCFIIFPGQHSSSHCRGSFTPLDAKRLPLCRVGCSSVRNWTVKFKYIE